MNGLPDRRRMFVRLDCGQNAEVEMRVFTAGVTIDRFVTSPGDGEVVIRMRLACDHHESEQEQPA